MNFTKEEKCISQQKEKVDLPVTVPCYLPVGFCTLVSSVSMLSSQFNIRYLQLINIVMSGACWAGACYETETILKSKKELRLHQQSKNIFFHFSSQILMSNQMFWLFWLGYFSWVYLFVCFICFSQTSNLKISIWFQTLFTNLTVTITLTGYHVFTATCIV